jgi:hypothetical protein
MNKSLISKVSFTILFLVIYYFIGQFVLMPLFINDECYYHSHKAPWYIELLFDFPSSEGYHPIPSNLWYFVFGGIGFFIGKLVAKLNVIKTD